MLTQTVEYALRAMVCLANHESSPLTRQALVEQTRTPSAYLAKIMKRLNRAGLVNAQRGPHGGFLLARRAESVSLLEVVNAVEPIPRIKTCPLGLRSHGSQLCALHRRLDDALQTFEQAFSQTTLADIVAEKSGSVPLCEERPVELVPLR